MILLLASVIMVSLFLRSLIISFNDRFKILVENTAQLSEEIKSLPAAIKKMQAEKVATLKKTSTTKKASSTKKSSSVSKNK